MTVKTTATTILTLLFALGASGACSTKVEGGSETNWLCSTDADCTGGKVCVAKACVAADGGSAPVASVTPPADAGVHMALTTVFTDLGNFTCRSGPDCGGGAIGRCLPQALQRDVNGQVPCIVLDALPPKGACTCNEPGLKPASTARVAPALDVLRQRGDCDATGTPACQDLCVCERTQMTGSALQSCRSDMTLAPGAAGWCYVDPTTGTDNPEVVGQCGGAKWRLIRLSTANLDGHPVVISCAESHVEPGPPGPGYVELGYSFTPWEEENLAFSGFSASEVAVETNSLWCFSGIGLVYGFDGRVSCPYGQIGQQASPTDPTHVDPSNQRCFMGSRNPVTVPVPPQLTSRPATKAVYCSCRCDGADKAASYCACPSGFECAPIVPDFGVGAADVAGSYCVKSDAIFHPGIDDASPLCDTGLMNCGPL